MKKDYIPYDQDLNQFARENRKEMTKPERKIWYYVLARKQTGYKFTRQKPIRDYIIDFYCAELRLGIEIDGDSHPYQEDYDRRRTQILESDGIKLVRYWNNDVMANIEGVYDDLMENIAQRKMELLPR